MELLTVLKELSAAVHYPSGNAIDTAKAALDGIAECEIKDGSLVAVMAGESAYTIMLDAHIDEIGFIVTSVDGGFVKVAKVGGIDIRTLPASEVIIHGKRDVIGVFATLPPHLKKGEDDLPELGDMVIDTGYDSLEGIVSAGDRVTFRREPRELFDGRLTGKSLDDRAGVAALIATAHKLKGKKLPCNVKFLFSDQEELGCLGAKTAAFTLSPDEAVAVDVSFGDGPDIAADKCGKLGKGPMIGVSPVLSADITDELKKIAIQKNIPYQIEVMGGKTSTNADVITLTKSGIPTALVSIPLRNMHTAAEVASTDDIEALALLLAEYVMKGGCYND